MRAEMPPLDSGAVTIYDEVPERGAGVRMKFIGFASGMTPHLIPRRGVDSFFLGAVVVAKKRREACDEELIRLCAAAARRDGVRCLHARFR